jgi:hypothetical protein
MVNTFRIQNAKAFFYAGSEYLMLYIKYGRYGVQQTVLKKFALPAYLFLF